MAELKAGDEVLVYRPSHKDGSPAKVVKIGRTLIHLQQGLRVETYDRDTQRLNGRQVGTGTYFRTAEQVKSSPSATLTLFSRSANAVSPSTAATSSPPIRSRRWSS
jgi:hypothetical protein